MSIKYLSLSTAESERLIIICYQQNMAQYGDKGQRKFHTKKRRAIGFAYSEKVSSFLPFYIFLSLFIPPFLLLFL